MTAEEDPRPIRRILVALDASPHSVAALEAAAELASAAGAELRGFFVEDVDLLRAGALPIAREVEYFSGRLRDVDTRDLELQLRARARRVRQLLERTASRQGVAFTFDSVRGRVTAELSAAAADVDLVSVGVVGHSRRRGPGSAVRALLEAAPAPLMVIRHGARLAGAVHVVYDGSSAAKAALGIGAEIVRLRERPLRVLVVAADEQEAREWTAEARERLAGLPGLRDVRFGVVPKLQASRLLSAAREHRCGLMILPRGALDGAGSRLARLLRRSDCPVLVVGRG